MSEELANHRVDAHHFKKCDIENGLSPGLQFEEVQTRNPVEQCRVLKRGWNDNRSTCDGEYTNTKRRKLAATSSTSSLKSKLPFAQDPSSPKAKMHCNEEQTASNPSLFSTSSDSTRRAICPSAVVKNVKQSCRPAVHGELSDKERRNRHAVVAGVAPAKGTCDGGLSLDCYPTHLSVEFAIGGELCRRIDRSNSGKNQLPLVTPTSPQAVSELAKTTPPLSKFPDVAVPMQAFINPDNATERQLANKHREMRLQPKRYTLPASDYIGRRTNNRLTRSTQHVTNVTPKNSMVFERLLSDGVLTMEQVKRGQAIGFCEAFRYKHGMLTDNLETKGLLTALRDRSVLTKEQIDEIRHPMKSRSDSVEALLDMLERRPAADFVKFCECLDKTNQQHIIKELL
jgi:hypothetical protein